MSLLLKQNIQPWHVLHPLLDACPSNYLITFVWNGQALPSNPRSSKMIQSYLGFGDNWVHPPKRPWVSAGCLGFGIPILTFGMTWRLGKKMHVHDMHSSTFWWLVSPRNWSWATVQQHEALGCWLWVHLEWTKISGFAIFLGGCWYMI